MMLEDVHGVSDQVEAMRLEIDKTHEKLKWTLEEENRQIAARD